MSAALKHIAAIAKGLSKAELHVLIELAARAEVAGGVMAQASSRELAEQTGLARASVQAAVDSLNRSGVIESDAGTPTRASQHRLMFLDAVENAVQNNAGGPIVRPEVAHKLGRWGLDSEPLVAQKLGQDGPTARPLVAQNLSHGGLRTEPRVAQFPGQGGLSSRPLPDGKSSTCEPPHIENASAPAKSIEKNDFDSLIDRLRKAQKSDFDHEVFEQARKMIASHHAKFAREGCQLVGWPDDQITAQFLAIADWPRLSAMLYDLSSERKESGHSWAWYVTVALQRIHGISPGKVRQMRDNSRSSCAVNPSNAFQRAHTPPESNRSSQPRDRITDDTQPNSINLQVRALAAMKAMR